MDSSDSIPKISIGDFAPAIASLGAGLLAAAWGWGVAGPTLGMILLPMVATPILISYLTCGIEKILSQALQWFGWCTGVSLVWMAVIGPGRAGVLGYAQVVAVLLGWSAMSLGLTRGLIRLGMNPLLAAAAVSVAQLAWIAWPIWCPVSNAQVANVLMQLHPVLVCNGMLTYLPPWTEMASAYQLTRLNQDLPVALPNSIFWNLCGSVSIAGAGLGVSFWHRRWPPVRRRRAGRRSKETTAR